VDAWVNSNSLRYHNKVSRSVRSKSRNADIGALWGPTMAKRCVNSRPKLRNFMNLNMCGFRYYSVGLHTF